jgi:hypothetical protein
MGNKSENTELKELRKKLSDKFNEIDKVLCQKTKDPVKKTIKKVAS